ncbi:MAG: hypothetical protein ACRDJH_21340 [Thermomicrobiales bacterium]
MIAPREWPGRASRSLLLLLLAARGRRLPRDQVLDALWPESEPGAALNALYKALHGLRRTLEPELKSGRDSAFVEAGGDAIGLRPTVDLWVDVDLFEAALAPSPRGNAGGAWALSRRSPGRRAMRRLAGRAP